MQNPPDDHPEDFIINRYMPGATEEEREAATYNLERFIAVLVRINERLENDMHLADSRTVDDFDRVGSMGYPPTI